MSNLMLKNSETKHQTQEGKKREGAAYYYECLKDRFRKIIRFVHFIFSCLFILSSCKNTLIVGILNPRIWIWNLIDSMLIQ